MLLIFDHGTTGIKTCLMDSHGQIVTRAYAHIDTRYPESGWVEQDALQLWDLTLDTAHEALTEQGIRWDAVRAIGLTNQRETTIVWDADTGRPVHPAIVWQCRRTEKLCKQFKAHEAMVRARTGLLIDPYFSATKIRWILDRVGASPSLRFGTVDSWITWMLSGGEAHVTDETNASRTLLYNIHERQWDEQLLELFGIPRDMLPEVRPSASIDVQSTASVTGGHAKPIAAILGDQQAALYGQRCWELGQAKATFGTGTFLMSMRGVDASPAAPGLLSTLACSGTGDVCYAQEGAVFTSGAALDWLCNGLHLAPNAKELDVLAESVKDSHGVHCVPALSGLGAPHWRPDARGSFTGLSSGATAAHLARAMYEALAFQTREVLELLAPVGSLKELRIDGGVTRSRLLHQLLADTLEIPVTRLKQADVTALGVGYLAGLSCGQWASAEEIKQLPQENVRVEPSVSRKSDYEAWRVRCSH